jgi:hypothetical protein
LLQRSAGSVALAILQPISAERSLAFSKASPGFGSGDEAVPIRKEKSLEGATLPPTQ